MNETLNVKIPPNYLIGWSMIIEGEIEIEGTLNNNGYILLKQTGKITNKGKGKIINTGVIDVRPTSIDKYENLGKITNTGTIFKNIKNFVEEGIIEEKEDNKYNFIGKSIGSNITLFINKGEEVIFNKNSNVEENGIIINNGKILIKPINNTYIQLINKGQILNDLGTIEIDGDYNDLDLLKTKYNSITNKNNGNIMNENEIIIKNNGVIYNENGKISNSSGISIENGLIYNDKNGTLINAGTINLMKKKVINSDEYDKAWESWESLDNIDFESMSKSTVGIISNNGGNITNYSIIRNVDNMGDEYTSGDIIHKSGNFINFDTGKILLNDRFSKSNYNFGIIYIGEKDKAKFINKGIIDFGEGHKHCWLTGPGEITIKKNGVIISSPQRMKDTPARKIYVPGEGKRFMTFEEYMVDFYVPKQIGSTTRRGETVITTKNYIINRKDRFGRYISYTADRSRYSEIYNPDPFNSSKYMVEADYKYEYITGNFYVNNKAVYTDLFGPFTSFNSRINFSNEIGFDWKKQWNTQNHFNSYNPYKSQSTDPDIYNSPVYGGDALVGTGLEHRYRSNVKTDSEFYTTLTPEHWYFKFSEPVRQANIKYESRHGKTVKNPNIGNEIKDKVFDKTKDTGWDSEDYNKVGIIIYYQSGYPYWKKYENFGETYRCNYIDLYYPYPYVKDKYPDKLDEIDIYNQGRLDFSGYQIIKKSNTDYPSFRPYIVNVQTRYDPNDPYILDTSREIKSDIRDIYLHYISLRKNLIEIKAYIGTDENNYDKNSLQTYWTDKNNDSTQIAYKRDAKSKKFEPVGQIVKYTYETRSWDFGSYKRDAPLKVNNYYLVNNEDAVFQHVRINYKIDENYNYFLIQP